MYSGIWDRGPEGGTPLFKWQVGMWRHPSIRVGRRTSSAWQTILYDPLLQRLCSEIFPQYLVTQLIHYKLSAREIEREGNKTAARHRQTSAHWNLGEDSLSGLILSGIDKKFDRLNILKLKFWSKKPWNSLRQSLYRALKYVLVCNKNWGFTKWSINKGKYKNISAYSIFKSYITINRSLRHNTWRKKV